MSVPSFDTLKFSQRPREAGLDERAALRGEMHRLLNDQLRWIVGIFLAGLGLLFALLRAFPA